jgi:hypothetical protein
LGNREEAGVEELMQTEADHSSKQMDGGWLLLAIPGWFLLYRLLLPLSEWATVRGFGLMLEPRLGSAAAFFHYDVPKVIMLLALVVLGVTFIQTFVSPEGTRDILARRAGAWSNLLASLLGSITPFCSCSAVPLFIGFVRGRVPLGATFSFLVSAPMVNEVALFLLLGLFGWMIAGLYALTGVLTAFLSGWILGKLKMERHLEAGVMEIPYQAQAASQDKMSFGERLAAAVQGVKESVIKVWPYILAGIAVGAFIHGCMPESLMVRFVGKSAWWSVPLAVLIDVPLYSNAAGINPIVPAPCWARAQPCARCSSPRSSPFSWASSPPESWWSGIFSISFSRACRHEIFNHRAKHRI